MAPNPRAKGRHGNSGRGRRLHQALPRAEWEAVIDGAAEDRHDPLIGARDQALVALLLFSGLRRAELASLDLDSVHCVETAAGQRWSLRVIGKGDKERRPALGAIAADLLECYLDVRPELEGDDQPLFVSRQRGANGWRLSPRQIQRIVKAAGVAAGLGDGLHTHALRHAFATEAVRQASRRGKSLFDVAEQLGHSDLETTRIYYAASDEDRQALVEDM